MLELFKHRIMKIQDFEGGLGSHSLRLDSLISCILETEVENQALLRMILRNQANQAADGDSELALGIEKDYYDKVKDLKNELMAQKMSKYST